MARTSIAACTIVSKNYLSLARVWNDSLKRQHPGARTFVLLVDRIDGAFDRNAENFEVLEAEELEIADFLDMAFKYNIVELNTALKPFLLDHLLRKKGVDRLLYFDPDTVLYGRLEKVQEALDEREIVLVPHILAPQKNDGRRPNETDFLISGAYNLGFLALKKSETVFSFLRWWQEKLVDDCFSAPERGLFTDQKWIDLVPSIFPGVGILKDRGYNVAYWNLQERMDLAERGGGYRFPECPLTFFHFSGLEFGKLERVSKYQNRFRFHNLTDSYRKLFSGYVEAIRAAGFEETKRLPYAFDAFEDGVRISAYLRLLYHRQGAERQRWGDPFRATGENTFRSWLLEPVEFGSNIPRLLESIYQSRPDVRAAIPGGKRENAKGLLTWAIGSTQKEYKLDGFFIRHFRRLLDQIEASEREAQEFERDPYFGEPRRPGKRTLQRVLTRPVYRTLRKRIWQYRSWSWRAAVKRARGVVAPAAAPVRDPTLPGGVNLFGYFDTESGVGEIARSMAAMLENAGIPHALVNVGQQWLRRNDRRIQNFSASNPYAANLFMINADQVPHVLGEIGEGARRGRINIGYWFWELSKFPAANAGSFSYFDEVWVASEFCLEAIAADSSIPVVKVPPGFEFEKPRGRRLRSSFGIRDEDFVFLYVFDSASSVARKNPAGLIRAFRSAFPDPGKERLVLKTINSTPQRDAALGRLAGSSQVEILSEYLDRHELLDLLATADCYVSLHRSEGLGLTLLESMALGKPVIATGYSGNADFLRPGVGFPVGYRLVPLRRTIGPYEKGSVWADPDLTEAARWMKFVAENPSEASRIGEAARKEIRKSWSVAAASRRLRERIEMLLGSQIPEGRIAR